jgi:hypothetical protein
MASQAPISWTHYGADESVREYLKRALTNANDAEREANIYLASRCVRSQKPFFAIYERWCRDGGDVPRTELDSAIAICALFLVHNYVDGDVSLLCRLVTDEYAIASQDVIQLLAVHATFFGRRAMLACIAKMLSKRTRLCDCVGLCHFAIVAPLDFADYSLKAQFEPNVDVHVTTCAPWPVLSVNDVCAVISSPPSSFVTTSTFAYLRDPTSVKAIKDLVAENGGRRFGFENPSSSPDNHDLFHLYDKFGFLVCTVHGCVLRRWPNMARATKTLPLSQQKKRCNRGGVRINLPLFASTIRAVVAYLNMCPPTSLDSQLLGSPPDYVRDGALDCDNLTYERRWMPGGTFAIEAANEIRASIKSGVGSDQFQPDRVLPGSSTIDEFAEISPYHPLFDKCGELEGLLKYADALVAWRHAAVEFSKSVYGCNSEEECLVALYAFVASVSFAVVGEDYSNCFSSASPHILAGRLKLIKEEDGNLFAALVDKDVVKVEDMVIGATQRKWATCFATRPGLVLLTTDELVHLHCFIGRNREDAAPWWTKLGSLMSYVDGYSQWNLERGRMNLTDSRRVLVSVASQMRYVLADFDQFVKSNGKAGVDDVTLRMSNAYGTTLWLISRLLGGYDGEFSVALLMLMPLLRRRLDDPRCGDPDIRELFSDVSIMPAFIASHFANCPINLDFFASTECAKHMPIFKERDDLAVFREYVMSSCAEVLSMLMPAPVLIRFLNVAVRACPTLAGAMASFRDLNGNSVLHIVAKRQLSDTFYRLAKWFEEECGSSNSTCAMAIADHNDKLETPAHLALTFPVQPGDMKDFEAFLLSTIFASGLNHGALAVDTARGSALHYASLSQSVEVVQWAMSRVTSVSSFNWNGQVPLDEFFAKHCVLGTNSEYSSNRLNEIRRALRKLSECSPPSSDQATSAMDVDARDAVEEEDVLWQYESDSNPEDDLVDVDQPDEEESN